jgi:Subunit CCDC53 of WASH complex
VEPLPAVLISAQPPGIVNNQPITETHQVDDSLPPENSKNTSTTPEVIADDNTEPDPNYTKFFKMVQFGVPPQAVKLKMQSEGLNPDFLE